MQLHQQAEPNFNTLASRVQVVYDDGEKNQSITVSLRMEKNETIWIKASILGITLAKAIITPERVSYYETISNTYFDGDFSLISDWLGTDLDFEQVQAILLGQSIFSFKDGKYEVSNTQNSYKIQPKKQPYNFIHSLFLNAENFKVASGSLSQPNEDRLFSLRYGEYQMVDGGFYPSDITIDASESSETDYYKGYSIYITSGPGIGQKRLITSYEPADKKVNFSNKKEWFYKEKKIIKIDPKIGFSQQNCV